MPTLSELNRRVQNNLPITTFKRKLQQNVILFPNIQIEKENVDYKYQSQKCENEFDGKGTCTRARCTFAHTMKELKKGLKRRKEHTGEPSIQCKWFKETGRCKYGDICKFNHDQPITKISNTSDRKYKTELCINEKDKNGNCVYVHCKFAHSQLELRPLYATKLKVKLTESARNINYDTIKQLWYIGIE